MARTVATAGRTVAVSGVTVAIVLASLMLFPQLFLRSMGYGGVAAVLVDMLAALIVLPALLAVLGPKVNSLGIRRFPGNPTAPIEAIVKFGALVAGSPSRTAGLAFGSLVLPVEAIVMNILSLGAMFGVVTWIFQDGHLSGLLGFTPNGTISPPSRS